MGKNIGASKCSVTRIAPQASSREAEGLMIRHQGFLAEAEGKGLVHKGKRVGSRSDPTLRHWCHKSTAPHSFLPMVALPFNQFSRWGRDPVRNNKLCCWVPDPSKPLRYAMHCPPFALSVWCHQIIRDPELFQSSEKRALSFLFLSFCTHIYLLLAVELASLSQSHIRLNSPAI